MKGKCEVSAAIWDLDGTLVDSLPGIHAALNAALSEKGLAGTTVAETSSYIGNGAWQLCRKAVAGSESLVDEVESGFKKAYAELWREGTQVYPGIPELLEFLSARGTPLAVLSNKPHPFTAEIVATLFRKNLFAEVMGHGPRFPKKPDPASALFLATRFGFPPEKIAYVGDSDVDLALAEAAGMQAVIVSWGYNAPGDHEPEARSVVELQRLFQ